MALLDSPPRDWKRPTMTLSAKVAAWERKYGPVNYDHRPPLSDRRFDTEAGDTVPPSNSPDHIEPISVEEHDRRTHGAGGEKRVTTLGSDAHRRAQRRSIKDSNAIHDAALASKAGDYGRAAEILSTARRSALKPKQRIKSRGFGDGKRKIQSRGFRR